MSDTEVEKTKESQNQEEEEMKTEDEQIVEKVDEKNENKTDDEWELLDADDDKQESVEEVRDEKTEESSMVIVESVKDDNSEEKQTKEVMEGIEDVIVDSPSDENLETKVQSGPVTDDTGKESDEPLKEQDIDTEPMVVKYGNDENGDVTVQAFADQEPTADADKAEATEPAEERTVDDDKQIEETDRGEDEHKDNLEETEKEQEEKEEKVEMAPTEDLTLPSLGDVQLLQSELLMERVKLRKRIGGAAGRRPPTKRASWTDGQGRPVSWMFADSAEPKLVDQEFSTDEEDEKEPEDNKMEEVQTPPKARIPIGGMPSPMLLPGLADAVKFRKKTPGRHTRDMGNASSKTNESTEVRSPPWAKNILKSPSNDGGLSPSWASGSAFKHPKPAKDIPEKRPKPAPRPRPKPRPKSIAVMSDIQGQPVLLSKELLQKIERQSSQRKDEEEKTVIVTKTENKLVNGQINKPTVSVLITTPSVEEKPQSPSPVLEKKLNSDIINAQKKMEDKKEKEDVPKTPQWSDQKKKLPPIPKNKPKPAARPAKPEKPTVSAQPQWKQDLVKKKKEDEAQGKKKPIVPQRKPNPNAPVITTLPDWQQDLAKKVQKKKGKESEKTPTEKGDEEKNEKDKIPDWKLQAAERAQRRKKLENANPPSNRPSHVDEVPHPDETPNWKKHMQEKKTDPPIDKENVVIKTVDTKQSDSDNVENNKEQSGNIPQWKKELMERRQRSRSLGDAKITDEANKKTIHISEIIPKDSSSVPSWKAELEKRKQARLEKTYKSMEQVEETF